MKGKGISPDVGEIYMLANPVAILEFEASGVVVADGEAEEEVGKEHLIRIHRDQCSPIFHKIWIVILSQSKTKFPQIQTA